MERNTNTGLLVETDRHAQFRNALLTIALGGPLLWTFLHVLNFYPVTVWDFAAEPRPLGSGPVHYYVLTGETIDGRYVNVPAVSTTNSLHDGNATLARATEANAEFLIRAPHPRNAQLWTRLRTLPPAVRMNDLLAAWGNAYNLRRGDNSPDLLRTVRLTEYEWPYVQYNDFEQLKASWQVDLSAP
jgi:hypothetical protein